MSCGYGIPSDKGKEALKKAISKKIVEKEKLVREQKLIKKDTDG